MLSLMSSNSRYKKRVGFIEDYYNDIFNSNSDIIDIQIELENITNVDEKISLLMYAMYKKLGIKLRTNQIEALLYMLDGNLFELDTGEGKTYIIAIYSVLKVLDKRVVFITTPSTYLSLKGYDILKPFYDIFEDIRVSTLYSGDKKDIYQSNIIYGTYRDFAIDFLNDSLQHSIDNIKQIKRDIVVCDEVDTSLIDESITPISITTLVPISDDIKSKYKNINSLIEDNSIIENRDYRCDYQNQSIELTSDGIKNIEELLKIDNLYDSDNIEYLNILENMLKVHKFLKRDKDYIVEGGKIKLLDSYGNILNGSMLLNGLQQALEIKEGITITALPKVINKISYSGYAKEFKNIVGCSGTLCEEGDILKVQYGLDCVYIKPFEKTKRKDLQDEIYSNMDSKIKRIIEIVLERNRKGQPVLIVTPSISEANLIKTELELNNKDLIYVDGINQNEKELENSGKKYSITVITGIGGRGIDIKIDDEVDKLGGLFVIGSGRGLSRRWDKQVRGRTGRNGKRGESQFILSLEDDLIVYFTDNKIKKTVDKLNVGDGNIYSRRLIKIFDKAQQNAESINHRYRVENIRYDDIYDKQRREVFSLRDKIVRDSYKLENILIEGKKIFSDYVIENYYYTNKIEEMFNRFFEITFSMDKRIKSEEDMRKLLNDFYNEIMKAKYANIDVTKFNSFVKLIILLNLDNSWSQHISNIENLQEGVQWRAIGNRDPFNEFSKEAYMMYENMLRKFKMDSFLALLTSNI